MSIVISAEGLEKSFGRTRVLDRVDLEVPAGSIFGFLGPNGSGKTTTIRALLGLIFLDAGRAQVLGATVPRLASVRARVGALVEGPGYVPYLSARDNLARLLAARGVASGARQRLIEAALERVGLGAVADRRVARFSLGMRQRLGIAQAIMTDAELLVLDEPTNGLDPAGMREVRRLLAALRDEGRTVFLSTHLLAEAELLCSHVAFMSQGRVVRQGPVSELREIDEPTWRLRGRPLERLLALPGATASADGVAVQVVAPRSAMPALIASAVERGIELEEVTPVLPSLEDLFLAEVGEGFDVR
ncbi:ABC transporter related [Acidimicrobium ferrooxidans DSM 10331]|uniref:ABC transporter related n=1 Tax=Acidimicrobium ferrooxidans (strain DSM 10331 / JCM 15462 / NBRC 103882 / ICP) TaxID=525909 RepID=C7LZI0_ACIFD|nr:ABC transporter ATP-binding protein [Acidimicrobium ferrooxidans]ACU54138.1 ABC transporter related [Acidimicrobium ferrooxidans DSM 10331]